MSAEGMSGLTPGQGGPPNDWGGTPEDLLTPGQPSPKAMADEDDFTLVRRDGKHRAASPPPSPSQNAQRVEDTQDASKDDTINSQTQATTGGASGGEDDGFDREEVRMIYRTAAIETGYKNLDRSEVARQVCDAVGERHILSIYRQPQEWQVVFLSLKACDEFVAQRSIIVDEESYMIRRVAERLPSGTTKWVRPYSIVRLHWLPRFVEDDCIKSRLLGNLNVQYVVAEKAITDDKFEGNVRKAKVFGDIDNLPFKTDLVFEGAKFPVRITIPGRPKVCWKCGQTGHVKSECQWKRSGGFSSLFKTAENFGMLEHDDDEDDRRQSDGTSTSTQAPTRTPFRPPPPPPKMTTPWVTKELTSKLASGAAGAGTSRAQAQQVKPVEKGKKVTVERKSREVEEKESVETGGNFNGAKGLLAMGVSMVKNVGKVLNGNGKGNGGSGEGEGGGSGEGRGGRGRQRSDSVGDVHQEMDDESTGVKRKQDFCHVPVAAMPSPATQRRIQAKKAKGPST